MCAKALKGIRHIHAGFRHIDGIYQHVILLPFNVKNLDGNMLLKLLGHM